MRLGSFRRPASRWCACWRSAIVPPPACGWDPSSSMPSWLDRPVRQRHCSWLPHSVPARYARRFRALLVRRSPGYPSSLSHVGDALRFVLRGGALACLVGATFGVTSLWLAGRIPLAAYGINWFLVAGDTLGVFVAGPLTWALVGAPEGVWRARRASLVPALLVTLAVVVGVFSLRLRENGRVSSVISRSVRTRARTSSVRPSGAISMPCWRPSDWSPR